MRPPARLAAVIEVLEELFSGKKCAADQVLTAYFRARRFIGSKDRRNIADRSFDLLRHHFRLRWHLAALLREPTARNLLLAYLVLVEKETPEATTAHFSAGGYGPASLSPAEADLVQKLHRRRLDEKEMPPWVASECPEWLWPRMEAALGRTAKKELSAFARSAPLDLRVNLLKTDRSAARESLAAEGVQAVETPYSHLGLRVTGRPALTASTAYRDGLVEPQDEASQLAALLLEAEPGQKVLDFCAGAGGKALALAAEMQNRGRLLLHDKNAARLSLSKVRLQRAGIEIAEIVSTPASLPAHRGTCDRVFVDAPCSATGRWRRQPDGRWQLTAKFLREVVDLQRRIVKQASDF
ncbi:MAG: RsmB/NOP family class I SAM-dependent RNA methyltransferase, partial [Kiloniellales bacterium]|nr:RsmB/NOP family class I SAM-dependent RNA methyltransferase [Kiloniellales bacterium]